MTRIEAKNGLAIVFNEDCSLTRDVKAMYDEAIDTVDEIYDYFERELAADGTELTVSYLCGVEAERRRNILKTCSSCKFFTDHEYPDHRDCKYDISMSQDFMILERDFGCNKWEKKR